MLFQNETLNINMSSIGNGNLRRVVIFSSVQQSEQIRCGGAGRQDFEEQVRRHRRAARGGLAAERQPDGQVPDSDVRGGRTGTPHQSQGGPRHVASR